jgi:predicted metal-dependent phosphoesterase TrpH
VSPPTVVRVDTHVHTADSFDSTETVDRVLTAAADAGLDGLVVTDHDGIANSRAAAARADEFGLVGIPGVEVSTADGHLLGIGVEDRPPAGLGFAETAARIREAGGVAVVPHPFQRTRHGVSAADISDPDGIEVFNAHSLTGLRNRQARAYAARRGYPRFAGSDAHRAETVGRAYTAVALDGPTPTREAVVAAMRAGRTRAVGQRTPRRHYVRKLAGTATRKPARILGVG